MKFKGVIMMKSLKKMLICIFIIISWSCVSTVHMEQVNEYYESGNEKAMESILDNPGKLENSDDITVVQEYYNELKKSRIESEIKTGIENGDLGILEQIVSGEYNDYATEEQQKNAVALYKKLLSEQVEAEIAEAHATINIYLKVHLVRLSTIYQHLSTIS